MIGQVIRGAIASAPNANRTTVNVISEVGAVLQAVNVKNVRMVNVKSKDPTKCHHIKI